QRISALRGMPDILPDEIKKWRHAEDAARTLFRQHGYEEIRTPLLEETALFNRSIGEETDIVQKQMYSFLDRGQREVSLRPEGTAPIARAYIEHGLGRAQETVKLYYIGPMFRNERPQAGRLRQFHQIGAEAMGSDSPYLDAEIISLMMRIITDCGLSDAELKINCLGCRKDKETFQQVLKTALSGQEINRLCEDCRKRYDRNILRVFDCKNEACRMALRSMPKVIDYLCPDCAARFDEVKTALELTGVKYTLFPFLVRGLDYYTGPVFEVSHKNLGSQDAVAAGGRYGDLILDLGGDRTPACGFAIGMERLLMAAPDKIGQGAGRQEIFVIALGSQARKKAFEVLNRLRNKGMSCQMAFDEKSLKSQMRFADKAGARKVLILGDTELKKGVAILRDMEQKQQKEISLDDVEDTHLW
ncbi:MAG: histidine--tRNA ligase, partial [Candidatus Omnitrophica bacterium]|nr:histidine--tRNA ligase [Candidatus Omnitrophota bacterium]